MRAWFHWASQWTISSGNSSGARDSELTALGGLDFGWQLSPTLRLTQVASTIIGEANSSTNSLTALNAKLTGALSARMATSNKDSMILNRPASTLGAVK